MTKLDGIKILHIVKGFDIGGNNGGAENFGVNLARSLRKQGINVSLCAYLKYDTPIEQYWCSQLSKDGIEVFFACPSKSPNIWEAKENIKNWLQNHQINIIHSHYQIGTITSALLKLSNTYSYLLRTVHAGLEFGASITGMISRLIFRDIIYPIIVNYEIGVSRSITQRLNQQIVRYILHKTAIWIPNAIPDGVEAEQPDDPFRKYVIPENVQRWIVTTIGVLVPIKNLDVLLNAMPEVLQQIPQAILVIVGSGSTLDSLVSLSKDLGVSESCWFLGQQQNIHAILMKSDIFVLPSSTEGISTVILEAMQCKVPVIASDIAGNRELISNEISGWLVPVGDVGGLAKAIIRAYHQPEVIKRMANEAYNQIDSYYMSNVSRKYLDIYSSLVQKV